MVTIVFLSIGLILLGQSLDRVFNPRVRARHEKTTAVDGRRRRKMTNRPVTDAAEVTNP